MSQDGQRRPDEGAASESLPGTSDIDSSEKPRHRQDRRSQLARRRAAALRCEPLASGQRDPQFAWGGR